MDQEILSTAKKSRSDVIKDLKQFINRDTILLGHSLNNDLHKLRLIHRRVIDTSVLYSSKTGKKHSLAELAFQYVKATIQKVAILSYLSTTTAVLRMPKQL